MKSLTVIMNTICYLQPFFLTARQHIDDPDFMAKAVPTNSFSVRKTGNDIVGVRKDIIIFPVHLIKLFHFRCTQSGDKHHRNAYLYQFFAELL